MSGFDEAEGSVTLNPECYGLGDFTGALGTLGQGQAQREREATRLGPVPSRLSTSL